MEVSQSIPGLRIFGIHSKTVRNAQAWNRLGDLHYSTGAFEEALHAYQKAVESDPDCILSYGNLASIYVQKGCHAEAIPMIQKGIELSKNATDTVSLVEPVGDAYRHLDDYEHGMAAYRNADALDPQKASTQPESSSNEPDMHFTLRRHSIQRYRFRTHGHAETGPATRVNYALRDLPAR